MSNHNHLKLKWSWVLLLLLTGLPSCKKFVEIPPPVTQITSATTYSDDKSAAAVMTGMYSNMMLLGYLSNGYNSISLLQGLAADELTNYAIDLNQSQFYQNALSSSTSGSSNGYYWTELYNEIHVANTVIEGLNTYKGVTPAIKQQLIGEAKFMRAFLHFYAVNLYGNIPLVTTTNYLTNNQIGQSSTTAVYQQIIQDLKDAQEALSDNYLDAYGVSTQEKTRPNKGTATALLARVYLYLGDLNRNDNTQYKYAEDQATAVVNSTAAYQLDSDLNQVFLSNSSEAIWQLAPVDPNQPNTGDAAYFVLTSIPGTGNQSVSLSNNFITAFETGDKRLNDWVGTFNDGSNNYYYPFKYKAHLQSDPPTEYLMVFRLAEQYLIRAEARAEQGNVPGAQSDLNVIRSRAGLSNTTANDKASLLKAIAHERQVELFTEWGHRWFDLKRTNTINSVMGSPGNVCAEKGGTWSADWALMPLPLGDLKIDPNLKQNPGY